MITAMGFFRPRIDAAANENAVPDTGEAALREVVIHWIFAVGLLTVVGAVLGVSL